MTTNIRIGVDVDDAGSTAALTKEGIKLKNIMVEAGAAAAKIRTPMATGAAQQGVAASNASRAPASAGYKAAAKEPTNTASDTNLSRGIGGARGAEGRDFAAQAQGLGGLVHVYATFAANLFAVSAAFTALKAAADTSNLIIGLDQLGAASGINLGSLSKRIVEATDGAVSLRDAMTATAQASSAGMSSKNIERMAAAARSTSQALGVGMTDALSRLSRGITKIEPELLDELGIMVKVDKASQDYARSLGKSASQLTDFEKRQGFANAVLDEAEKKFSAINMAANPYSKLSSSLANLAQSGLEVVNKVATPLLSFLSSSPTALALTIGYIATTLLKQAIPALTQWRTGLDDMASNASKNAAHIKQSFEEFQVQKGLGPGFALEKEAEMHRSAASEIIKNNKLFKASSDIASQASNEGGAFNAKSLGAVKAAITNTTKEIALYNKELKLSTDPAEQAALTKKISGLNKVKDTYAMLGDTIAKSMKAAKESVESLGAAEINLDKKASYLSEYAQRERIMKSAEQKASSTGVLSQVGKNTQFMGVTDAFRQMWLDVTTGVTSETGEKLTKPIEGIRKYATAASGSVRILASAGMTLISSLGTLGMIAGVLGGAFATLSAVFSKNEKEMAKFSHALEDTKSNGENVARVLENIAKQDPLKQMSIASISAIANAFNGLTDSILGLDIATKKALKSLDASNFDTFTNWVTKAWGGDIASKAAESMSTALIDSISLLDEGAIKDTYKEKLASILNITLVNPENIKNAVEAISKLDPSLVSMKFKELGKETGNVNRIINNSSSNLIAYKEAFDIVIKSSQDFTTSLANTDPLFKYGASLLVLSDSLTKLSSSPVEANAAFLDLLQNTNKLAQFSEATTGRLVGMKDAFLANASAAKTNANAIKEANDKIEKANTAAARYEIARYKKAGLSSEDTIAAGNAEKANPATRAAAVLLEAEAAAGEIKRMIAKSNADFADTISKARTTVAVGTQEAFMKGAELIDKALGMATAKSALEISKAAGVGLTGSRATEQGLALVKQEVSLRIQEIALREREILNLAKLNNTIQLSDARKAVLENAAIAGGGLKDAPELDKTVKVLESIGKALEGGATGIKTAYTAGRVSSKDTTPEGVAAQDINQKVAQGVSGMYTQTAALTSAKIIENTKILTAEIAAQYKMTSDLSEKKQRDLKSTVDIKTEEANRLSILESISGGIDADLTVRKIAAQNAAEAAKQESDNLTLQDRFSAALNLSLNTKISLQDRSLQLAEALNTASILGAQMNAQEAKNQSKILADRQTMLKGELETSKRDYEVLVSKNTLQNIILTTEQQISEARYSAYVALGNLTEVEKASGIYNIELAKSNLAMQIAVNDKLAQTIELEKTRNLEKSKLAGTDATKFQTETDRQVALNNAAIQGLQIEGAARKTILDINKESSTFLGKQVDDMTKMVDITNSLSSVFGALGDSIGKTGQAFLKMSQDGSNFAKQSLAIQTKINAVEESGDTVGSDLLKEKTDLDKKANKVELANIANVAGASKKLFSEKTFAYKALAGVEKVIHIVKLGMMAAEIVADITGTTSSVANSAIRTGASIVEAGVDGAKAVVKAISAFPPPFNFIAGAATAAVVGGLLSSIGGSSPEVGSAPSIPAGTSSADRQETQGTGQSWVNGTKQDNGGGVFGNSSAKSAAIVDSLAIMRDNSVEGIAYDNKMLIALEKLANSVVGAAKSLYSIPGLRAGKGFGTSEGNTSTPGFGASIPLVGKLFSSIFGGGTSASASVTSAGVQLQGSFDDVMKDVKGSIIQYKDVLTQFHEDGGWFSSDRDWTTLNRETQALKSNASTAISDIFKDANSLFIELGKTSGTTASQIADSLKTIDVSIPVDLMNLTGQALIDELNGVIGSKLSEAATIIFPGFDKFKSFGEDYLTTVIRVVDTSVKVKQAFDSLGMSLGTTGSTTYEVSDAFVKASGGLSNFLGSIQLVSEIFVTESEQLNATQRSVSTTLASLSKGTSETTSVAIDLFKEVSDNKDSLINTKTEYYNLIKAAKSTAEVIVATEDTIGAARRQEAVNLYASLTNPALLKAQKAIWDAAKTYADSQAKQSLVIYGLLGNTEKELLLTREAELAALDSRLMAGQKYIYALNDEAIIKSKLKAAYDKQNTGLTTTVSTLNNFIKSITAARDALVLGAQSTLTPSEKYAEAKSQVETLKSVMATTGMDDASVIARNDALSKLPSVTGTFLEASKVLYASSAQYTKDFTSVLDLLDNTASSLALQQTDAEKQLAELIASSKSLNNIVDNTETIANLLAQLLAAQGVTAAAKVAAGDSGVTAAQGAGYTSQDQRSVEGFYKQYLHRASDADGMAWQLANINNGKYTVAQIGDAIKNSPEAKAQILYEKLAGRVGEAGGINYWRNQASLGISKEELITNFAKSVIATEGNTGTELAKKIAAGSAPPVVPGYEKGGLPNGVSWVGEKGPELVDFATPSRVYSNKASNDMFNNKELVAEIKRLNATVDKLVKDQNMQTGHLIASNFAANAEAAQKVVDATLEATNNSNWKERSAIKIA